MLQYLRTTDDLDIYNNSGDHTELLNRIHSGKSILITDSCLPAQRYAEDYIYGFPRLSSLLNSIVEWCIRRGVIDQRDTIEDFRQLIRKKQLTLVTYKLEEYLTNKSQQQQCLKEVLHEQAQISPFSLLFIGFEEGDPDLEIFKDTYEDVDVFHKLRTYWVVVPGGKLFEFEIKFLWVSKSRIKSISFLSDETYTKSQSFLETSASINTTFKNNKQELQDLQEKLTQLIERTQQKQLLTPSKELQLGQPITVFIAYTNRGEDVQKGIEEQLSILKVNQRYNIAFISIEVATDMRWEGRNHVVEDKLILLLVTSDFLVTKYCKSEQLRQAVDKHGEEVYVLPVICQKSVIRVLEGSIVNKLPKRTPKNGKAINEFRKWDFAIDSITEDIIEALDWAKREEKQMTADPKQVFVVYGRNSEARQQMFAFLRAIGLDPIEWSRAMALTHKGAPSILDVLKAGFSVAQAVVVLLTGDDEARLKSEYQSPNDPDHEKNLTPQARPNVIFEAGMAFGLQPDRTILVELGSLRPFSDVAGLHTVRISNDPKKKLELAQKLMTVGCAVDFSGSDWINEKYFNL